MPVIEAEEDISVLKFDEEEVKPAESLAIEPVEEEVIPEGSAKWPPFITEIDNIYKSNRSHVFLLHGNVNDYPDNTGVRGNLAMTMFTRYDTFWLNEKLKQEAANLGNSYSFQIPKILSISCKYSMPDGLVFATPESHKAFVALLKSDARYAEVPDNDDVFKPTEIGKTLAVLNDFFRLSAIRFAENQPLRSRLLKGGISASEKARINADLGKKPEVNMTVLWYDAKMCFPDGQISSLLYDRAPISFIENWALDGSIACRNKVILVAPSAQDVQISIRTSDSRVASIRVKRPSLQDRKEWIQNFQDYVKTTPAIINGQAKSDITFEEDLTEEILANNTAGMSRVQIEGVFMESWLGDVKVDLSMIAAHKRAAIEAEYGDILDIQQPTFTLDVIGGHHLIKDYFEQYIVEPLLLGDKRRCIRGVVLSGPPGTGKTVLAQGLAGVCRMNFVSVDFSKLFGGIVGETEKKTARLFEAIEAMAPCIVFMDEIDSSFSNGRQSSGDSGVQARMFNKVMTWLSDPARWGKVVAIAATNRPDLLDPAFIRPGRFDDIIPALPPAACDARGRGSILTSLCKKNGVSFAKGFEKTTKDKVTGWGRLLLDERIWTGAEIERLLNLSFGNAAQREAKATRDLYKDVPRKEQLEKIREATKKPKISIPDWDDAFDNYRPSTGAVEQQIDLALLFCNNLKYCPEDWKSRMKDESALKSTLSSMSGYAAAASYDRG